MIDKDKLEKWGSRNLMTFEESNLASPTFGMHQQYGLGTDWLGKALLKGLEGPGGPQVE